MLANTQSFGYAGIACCVNFERISLYCGSNCILDTNTESWGIKVSGVEVKHIDLPPDMQRAMAKQAEAERERRAKVIAAEGEFQAATKLREAADELSRNPATIQLRYLQTVSSMMTSARHPSG
jgi:hypothetical protein